MLYTQAKITIYLVRELGITTMQVLFHKVSDEPRFGHLVGKFFVYPIRSIPLAHIAQVTPERTGGVATKLCAGDIEKSVHIYTGDRYIALISEPDKDSIEPQIVSMIPRRDYVGIVDSLRPIHVEFTHDTVFELDIPAWSRKVTGTMRTIIDKIILHSKGDILDVINRNDNKWWTKFEGEESYTQVWPIVPEITPDYISSAMEHPAKPPTPKPPDKKKGVKGDESKPPKKLEKVAEKTAKKPPTKTPGLARTKRKA